MPSREKLLRDVITVQEMLVKLHKHVVERQVNLLDYLGSSTNLTNDKRVVAFNYQRMIIYCALNDAKSFYRNLSCFDYRALKSEIQENFEEELMVKAIRNYSIFNFIIRFSSIIETGGRNFLSNEQFNRYKGEFDKAEPDLSSADSILKSWRNTLHENGYLNLKGMKVKVHIYRNKEVVFEKNKVFRGDLWLLYRICKDSSDLLYRYALKNLNEEPYSKEHNSEEE